MSASHGSHCRCWECIDRENRPQRTTTNQASGVAEVCPDCDIADCFHIRARRAALATKPAAPAEVVAPVWRCFHCDVVYTDREEARQHFGLPGDVAEPFCRTALGRALMLRRTATPPAAPAATEAQSTPTQAPSTGAVVLNDEQIDAIALLCHAASTRSTPLPLDAAEAMVRQVVSESRVFRVAPPVVQPASPAIDASLIGADGGYYDRPASPAVEVAFKPVLIEFEDAHDTAWQAAAAFRPPYFGNNFRAHNWVVEAIRSAHMDGQRFAHGLPKINRAIGGELPQALREQRATPPAAASSTAHPVEWTPMAEQFDDGAGASSTEPASLSDAEIVEIWGNYDEGVDTRRDVVLRAIRFATPTPAVAVPGSLTDEQIAILRRTTMKDPHQQRASDIAFARAIIAALATTSTAGASLRAVAESIEKACPNDIDPGDGAVLVALSAAEVIALRSALASKDQS